MQSKTKYAVTRAQVEALFDSAGLGGVTAITPLSDGWYNAVLAVTAGGVDYVLKVAPEPGITVLAHERNLLCQELRFIALLEEQTTIRVPKVFAQGLDKALLPCDWFIMEKLGGIRLDKARLKGAARQDADAQIAQILEQFHALQGAGFGYEQMGLEANWYLALRKMTQALVEDCAGFRKRCARGKKLLRYIELHREILEAVPGVLVNFDLHTMNLFYQDEKLTVIDLERCFWGDWVGDCIMRGYAPPKHFSREEQIRFYLLEAYLATVAHSEKYSRYRPWNKAWWVDVTASAYFVCKSFSALRRLRRKG
ncbi:MAG: aminoglycoside phosphotransferase family protein [Oscillospiraceae bacterium]|nr:aminoglycoside phosphotransferase family protein [Oscillospiraceae bacterium]